MWMKVSVAIGLKLLLAIKATVIIGITRMKVRSPSPALHSKTKQNKNGHAYNLIRRAINHQRCTLIDFH